MLIFTTEASAEATTVQLSTRNWRRLIVELAATPYDEKQARRARENDPATTAAVIARLVPDDEADLTLRRIRLTARDFNLVRRVAGEIA